MSKTPTLPMGNAHIVPTKAAHLLGISRRTIMRAINTHELKARRNNRNHWEVALDDLREWALAHWAPSGHAHPQTPTNNDSPELLAKIASYEAENVQLKERLKDVQLDRDAWREMAHKRHRWWPWK